LDSGGKEQPAAAGAEDGEEEGEMPEGEEGEEGEMPEEGEPPKEEPPKDEL